MRTIDPSIKYMATTACIEQEDGWSKLHSLPLFYRRFSFLALLNELTFLNKKKKKKGNVVRDFR